MAKTKDTKTGKGDKSAKPGKATGSGKAGRSGKSAKADKAGRSDKAGKAGKADRGAPSRAAAPYASPEAGAVAPVDIGIPERDRREISQNLSQFLSDSFTLYLKTHNFHWNVTGPMFNSLHAMFMDQYTEQWNALDETAERIRALGYNAPGSYAEFIRLSSIPEEPGLTEAPDWRDMVQQLVAGNEAVCRTARRALSHADDAGDDPTVDLLTQRLQVHEKNAWMLRSLLQ